MNNIIKGHIPVIFVDGENIPEAWERSLISLYKNGCDIKTEYDKKDDPFSKDCSMTIVVNDPLSEPMIHLNMPGGLEDLQEYVLEVTEGIKDHLIRDEKTDKNDTRWEYTYHQRLFNYNVPGMPNMYDQIDLIVDKLSKTPHSRRAQAITWKVWEDSVCYDPACLQSIWCRLLKGVDKTWYLNGNIRFRSNDAYKAAFMNMFALVSLLKKIADNISERLDEKVVLGRYLHQADSYHIYGSYFKDFQEGFLKSLERRTFAERTVSYTDMKMIMDDAIPFIRKKAKEMGSH
jgi:thymidylate synthase